MLINQEQGGHEARAAAITLHLKEVKPKANAKKLLSALVRKGRVHVNGRDPLHLIWYSQTNELDLVKKVDELTEDQVYLGFLRGELTSGSERWIAPRIHISEELEYVPGFVGGERTHSLICPRSSDSLVKAIAEAVLSWHAVSDELREKCSSARKSAIGMFMLDANQFGVRLLAHHLRWRK